MSNRRSELESWASVAILGTGLIGGSIGLALRRAAPGLEVRGYDADRASSRAAVDRDALSSAHASAAAALAGCELALICTPVDSMDELCGRVGDQVEGDCYVTDVGSAKRGPVAAGEAAFGGRFVGGHPMAGSERHGIEAADERLFEGAWWVLTPTERTDPAAYAAVSEIVGALGAKPIALDPEAHDSLVARLSHVPQLTASALVAVAAASGDNETLLSLAARGFRDVTRIAASRPELWVAILRANREAVLEALAELGDHLGEAAALIEGGRWDELRAWLDEARTARLARFVKPAFGGEPVSLTMMVPDRPGVLAEVTTAAGQLGANLEDLRIVHSTEGGSGRLELVVAGKPSAELLLGELVRLGYRVERGGVDL